MERKEVGIAPDRSVVSEEVQYWEYAHLGDFTGHDQTGAKGESARNPEPPFGFRLRETPVTFKLTEAGAVHKA
jgi:hypothetical protein